MLQNSRIQLSLGVVLTLAAVICAFLILNNAKPAHAGVTLVVSKETADGGSAPDSGMFNDTYCSLQEAMYTARTNTLHPNNDCGNVPGSLGNLDVITFEAGAGTLTFTLTSTLDTGTGGGGPLLIANQAANAVNISGNDAVRVLFVDIGQSVELDDVTLSHGKIDVGCGAGIFTAGPLTLKRVSMYNHKNTANAGASAICSSGQVTIMDSSIFVNFAPANGDALELDGGINSITNSNLAENDGNAIRTNVGATLDITNSTIGVTGGAPLLSAQFGTTINLLNDTIYNDGAGPLLAGTVTAKNTIFSSTDGCSTVVADNGHNLDTGHLCVSNTNNGSLIDANPMLGAPVGNLGGNTPVRPLLTGSQAIDNGTNTGCPAKDQRQTINRPIDGDGNGTATCDIGAFEADAGTNPTASPSPSPSPTPSPTPTHSPSPTPTPSGTATAIPTATATASPTPTSTGPTVTPNPNPMQGDVDCDDDVDLDDFDVLITYAAELNDGFGPPGCLNLNDPESNSGLPWGDVNCDTFVNALDGLFVLAHTVQIDLQQAGQCFSIGEVMT